MTPPNPLRGADWPSQMTPPVNAVVAIRRDIAQKYFIEWAVARLGTHCCSKDLSNPTTLSVMIPIVDYHESGHGFLF